MPSPIKEVARNLYVAESTVWRVVDRFESTGSVSPNICSAYNTKSLVLVYTALHTTFTVNVHK